MTKVWTAAHGWVYLHVAVDCCTREVTCWRLDVRTRSEEAIACVEAGLLARAVPPGRLTLGSDNGSQFTSRDFGKHLSARGVTHRRGGYRDPESQAFIESWFGQFKKRCAWRAEWENIEQARAEIGDYIDRYHHRPHSGIGYRTPTEVAATFLILLTLRLGAVTVFPSSRPMLREFNSNDLHTSVVVAKRGSLRDMNGRNLSADLSLDSVYSDNSLIGFSSLEDEAVLDREVKYLSGLLHLPESDIRSKLNRGGSRAVLLKRFVSAKVSEQLTLPTFYNIFTVPDIERYQPYAEVSGGIIGSVDNGGAGPTEYEQLFDAELRGKNGVRTREISARYDQSGKLVKEVKALDGQSVTTTLELPLMQNLKKGLTAGQSVSVFSIDSKAPSEWQLSAYVQHDPVVLSSSDCAMPPSFIPASLQFPKSFNMDVRVLATVVGTSSLAIRLGWVDQALATMGATSSTGRVRCLTSKLPLTSAPVQPIKVCLLGQTFTAVRAFQRSGLKAIRLAAMASGGRFKEVILTTNGSMSALGLLKGGVHDTCGR